MKSKVETSERTRSERIKQMWYSATRSISFCSFISLLHESWEPSINHRTTLRSVGIEYAEWINEVWSWDAWTNSSIANFNKKPTTLLQKALTSAPHHTSLPIVRTTAIKISPTISVEARFDPFLSTNWNRISRIKTSSTKYSRFIVEMTRWSILTNFCCSLSLLFGLREAKRTQCVSKIMWSKKNTVFLNYVGTSVDLILWNSREWWRHSTS